MREEAENQGDHFPDFHHQESRVTALEDAIKRLNAELRAQRAVNEALSDWERILVSNDPSAYRVRAALREALR